MTLSFCKMPETRSTAIDFIKCFACLGVLSIHFSMFYGTRYIIFIRPFVSISVPCFMSVSGYLLYYRKERSYKEILCGPFLQYLSIFLIWSISSTLYWWIKSKPDESILYYAAYNSEGWHLWYLKVYLQVLFCYPFIRMITKHKELYRIFSVFWVIFISLRYSFEAWFHINPVYLRVIQLPFFQYSGIISGTVKGYYPLEALGIFIMGGAIIKFFETSTMKNELNRNIGCRVILLGVLTYIFTCFAAKMYDSPNVFAYICDPYMINVIIMMFSFIMLSYVVCEKIQSNYIKGLLSWFADKTLGIYILQAILNRKIISLLDQLNITNEIVRKVSIYFGIIVGGGDTYKCCT